MTIFLRIILIALGLIIANLVIFDFQPGSRYLILMEAVISGFIAHGIGSLMGNSVERRLRSLLSASGLIIVLGLTRLVFSGIKLAIPGVLLVYCGLVLVEMALPEKERKSVRVES